MPRLADETLVAAHETVLDRWKKTKPEQYWRLHESVRQDPVYRPLRPSKTEDEFYRERGEYLTSLPRFQLRAVYDPLNETQHASIEIALVEDRKRMGVYRGSVAAIRRGTVNWPDDVTEFARDAIRDSETKHKSAGNDSDIDPSVADVFSNLLFELFPPTVVERAAVSRRVDEYDVYRALDELQGILASELPRLVREYQVGEFGDSYVELFADENLIDDVLFGYDDDLLSAVAVAHSRASDAAARAVDQPILIGGSEKTIRRVRKTAEQN